jgi:hypothetical protein
MTEQTRDQEEQHKRAHAVVQIDAIDSEPEMDSDVTAPTLDSFSTPETD